MRFSTRDFAAERRGARLTVACGAMLALLGAAGIALMLLGRSSPS